MERFYHQQKHSKENQVGILQAEGKEFRYKFRNTGKNEDQQRP